jgi:type IV secretory pathway TrbF-like protein
MVGILHFAHRNARAVALTTMALGVVLAGTIGWLSAPV